MLPHTPGPDEADEGGVAPTRRRKRVRPREATADGFEAVGEPEAEVAEPEPMAAAAASGAAAAGSAATPSRAGHAPRAQPMLRLLLQQLGIQSDAVHRRVKEVGFDRLARLPLHDQKALLSAQPMVAACAEELRALWPLLSVHAAGMTALSGAEVGQAARALKDRYLADVLRDALALLVGLGVLACGPKLPNQLWFPSSRARRLETEIPRDALLPTPAPSQAGDRQKEDQEEGEEDGSQMSAAVLRAVGQVAVDRALLTLPAVNAAEGRLLDSAINVVNPPEHGEAHVGSKRPGVWGGQVFLGQHGGKRQRTGESWADALPELTPQQHQELQHAVGGGPADAAEALRRLVESRGAAGCSEDEAAALVPHTQPEVAAAAAHWAARTLLDQGHATVVPGFLGLRLVSRVAALGYSPRWPWEHPITGKADRRLLEPIVLHLLDTVLSRPGLSDARLYRRMMDVCGPSSVDRLLGLLEDLGTIHSEVVVTSTPPTKVPSFLRRGAEPAQEVTVRCIFADPDRASRVEEQVARLMATLT